jgi:hypothetical protein
MEDKARLFVEWKSLQRSLMRGGDLRYVKKDDVPQLDNLNLNVMHLINCGARTDRP